MQLYIKVYPFAQETKIKSKEQDLFGNDLWKISVNAVPEKGKANAELIKFLSKHFKVAKSNISIKQGQTSGLKIVEIDGI